MIGIPNLDILAPLGASITWAAANYLYKKPVENVPVVVASAVRLLGAVVFNLLLLVIYRPELHSLQLSSTLLIGAGAIVTLVIGDSFYFKSIKRDGVQLSTVVSSSYPIFVVIIMLVIVQVMPGWMGVVGTALVVAGLALVGTPKDKEKHIDVHDGHAKKRHIGYGMYALAAACAWAVGIVIFDHVLVIAHQVVLNAVRTVIGLSALTIIILASGRHHMLCRLDARSAIQLMLAGVLSQGVAQFLLYTGLRHGDATRVVPLASLAPFFSILFMVGSGRERFSLKIVLAAVLIVLGATMVAV